LTRIVLGILVAGVIALMLAVPQIGGVDTWKWVLGAIGLAVFLAAGRRRSAL
jgi:uncharacterized membrane protein YeiH